MTRALALLAAAAAMLDPFTRDWSRERWQASRLDMIAALTFLPLDRLASPSALTDLLADISTG